MEFQRWEMGIITSPKSYTKEKRLSKKGKEKLFIFGQKGSDSKASIYGEAAVARGRWGEVCRSTNLKNKGLISAPRKRSFARLLTIPCFIVKSSAKDLSSTIFSFDN
jgi:hypothetical protein